MENVINVALSKLTPHDHSECLSILTAAQVPLAVISRVIFMPPQGRANDRRTDHRTAAVIDRGRAILQCSDEQDARQYLLLKQVPFSLIQRALYDARHRDP
jgi:hypothetical protein